MYLIQHLSSCRWHLPLASRRLFSTTTTGAAAAASSSLKPKVIVLAGATGVGKTRLSLALAQHLNGEIINADSVQQYAGMDIGSNKLPLDQRQGIPHHCFDLSPISRPIAVTDYSKHAHNAIDDIIARGKVPILVGGSGFYLRWFFHPPHQPRVPSDISALVQQLLDDGRNAAAEESMVDMQVLTERIRDLPTEKFRHQKKNLSLEVLENKRIANSRRYATYYLEQILAFGKLPDTYIPPTIDTIRSLPFDYRCYYLSCDREWLNRWIDFRCEQLIENGMLQEVKRLEMKENLSQHATVAAAIGYRQALQYLSVLTSSASSASRYSDAATFEKELIDTFPRFLATMQSATRNYVRKQDVWFRKDPFYQFLRIPTPALPSFPLKSFQRFQETKVDLHTWADVEQQVLQQMDMSEKDYWNQPMWQVNQTVAADAVHETDNGLSEEDSVELDYDASSSPSSDADAIAPAAAPTIESLSAYKSLAFTPSPALAQSLQSALRLQTNLGSRAEQKRRRQYQTQNFIYDQNANKTAIRKIVQEVIQYNPLQEK